MKQLLDDSPKIRLLLAISYGNTESFNKCIREGAKVLDTNFNALTTVIRQIHSRQTVQSPKVESAVEMCKFIMNSYPEIVTTEHAKCIITYQNQQLLECLTKNANFSTFAVDILQQHCLHKWDISKMTGNIGQSTGKTSSIYKTLFEKRLVSARIQLEYLFTRGFDLSFTVKGKSGWEHLCQNFVFPLCEMSSQAITGVQESSEKTQPDDVSVGNLSDEFSNFTGEIRPDQLAALCTDCPISSTELQLAIKLIEAIVLSRKITFKMAKVVLAYITTSKTISSFLRYKITVLISRNYWKQCSNMSNNELSTLFFMGTSGLDELTYEMELAYCAKISYDCKIWHKAKCEKEQVLKSKLEKARKALEKCRRRKSDGDEAKKSEEHYEKKYLLAKVRHEKAVGEYSKWRSDIKGYIQISFGLATKIKSAFVHELVLRRRENLATLEN